MSTAANKRLPALPAAFYIGALFNNTAPAQPVLLVVAVCFFGRIAYLPAAALLACLLLFRIVLHVVQGLVIIVGLLLTAFSGAGRIVLLAFLVRMRLVINVGLGFVVHTICFEDGCKKQTTKGLQLIKAIIHA